MKSYFAGMFNYDKYANNIIADLLVSNNATGRAMNVMAHLLTTYQTWLKRCKGIAAPGGPIWPEPSPADFKTIIAQNHTDWLEYIDTLQDADYNRVITYQTSSGMSYSNILVDIITHVINHGTHHRGQIGTLLKVDGLQELPMLDYILYIREKKI